MSQRKDIDWMVMKGDALSEEILREARIDTAAGIFSVLPTDADNLFVVLSARSLNAGIWIETRIAQETTRSKMIQAGANRVLSPYHVAGIQMARSMLKPQVDEFLEIFLGDSNYEFEVKIHKIEESEANAGKQLLDWKFIEEGFMVIAIQFPEGRMMYAPNGTTRIPAGASVFLLGKGKH